MPDALTTRVERVQSAALTIVAVAIGVSVIYKSFFSGSAGPDYDPVYVDSWETAVPIARHVGGTPNAPVQIVVLTDLECPACRAFHTTVSEVAIRRSQDVQVLYVHHPLSYHRHALPGARAAECAAEEGDFARFVDVVFAAQDSLGIKSWGLFAASAGITDTTRIARCALGEVIPQFVEGGLEFGEAIGLDGTPTVLIGGWMYPEPPSRRELDQAITDLRNGREPHAIAR